MKRKTPKNNLLPPVQKRTRMSGNMTKAEQRALNIVSQRFEFLQKAGFQFGAKRDLWTTAGYERTPKFDHYWGMYKRGDIAGRIVDMAPKTTWRQPPELIETAVIEKMERKKPPAKYAETENPFEKAKPKKPGENPFEKKPGESGEEDTEGKGAPNSSAAEDPESDPKTKKKRKNPFAKAERAELWMARNQLPDSEFAEAVNDLAKKLKLWRYFERVDRLAGVGRYAVLLIGTRGTDDQTMQQPLKKVTNAEDVMYLACYHEQNAKIETWVTDPEDERFGLPLMYKVKFTSGIDNFRPTGASSELLVHHSRIIHVAEDCLEDEVFGRPRLERPMNRLYDLEKIAASTGEAYWLTVARILQAKIDPQAEMSAAQITELDERLMEMTHDLRRQFTGKGVELGWLEASVPPVKDVGDFYFSIIAGASGIPKRILFGAELGELASTTDQENWFGLVGERQEQFAEPTILRPFIDKMIMIGALPTPKDGEYTVMWPPLSEESSLEKAQINQIKAQVAVALTPVGGNPQELVEIDEEGDLHLPPRAPAEPMPLPMPGLPTDTVAGGPEPPPGFAGLGPEKKKKPPFGKSDGKDEEDDEDEEEEGA